MTESAAGTLGARLAAWARAGGGEQFARLGYSSLDRIGDAPANDADYGESAAIEKIVQAMAQSGRWKEARVLRAEYFLGGLSEPARLRALKRKGCDVSRAAYYVYLASAQAFVAGALAKNGTARLADPLQARLDAWLGERHLATTTDIIAALDLGQAQDRALQMRVAALMSALGWEKQRPRHRAGAARTRYWRRRTQPYPT